MKRPTAWSLAVGAMVLVVLGLIAAQALKGLDEDQAFDDSPAPPCPEGYVDRVGDSARIREQLGTVREGRALLDGLRHPIRMCFGEVDVPVVTEGRVLVLDQRVGVAERSARAGHLLHHVVHGMPFPEEVGADADCEAIVQTALDREAEAHTLEIALRRAFSLPPDRYEIEAELARMPEEQRVGRMRRYLEAHPDGARNIDGLVHAYRQRCELERRERRP